MSAAAETRTDLLVIGAGSGGLSVAAGAVQMGARVTLIEGGEMGGDCLNYGCVPSKALIAAGKAAQAMREGARFGITPVEPEIDYAAAQEHVARTIARIAPVDSQERFEGLGVRVIRDWARFLSPHVVEAGGERIRARRIVIATGSSPLVPPIPGLDTVPYLTNESLFQLRIRPEHLLIIGGGPIGMEMAQAHLRLGCRVSVIEGDRALNREDPDCAAVVLDRLRAEGLELLEGAQASAVRVCDGGVEVETAQGQKIAGSHLLVAVGRKPGIERLDLEAAGIATEKGAIKVGADLRTSQRHVYAIGDVTGGAQFTHTANYQAGIVLRSALFALPAKARHAHLPRATYTDPELAQVGLTEAEARARHGAALEVASFDFDENDRAIAEGREAGLIKVMVVSGRPVGVSIVGHGAGDLISLWSLVLARGLKLGAVAGMVAPYPSYGEVSKRAAGAYFSPRLFDSSLVKGVVRAVQRWLP